MEKIMPFVNVPKSKWKAMDRCVKDVMREQNVSKDRAIAICHSSIVGGKKSKKKGKKSMDINVNLYKGYWDSQTADRITNHTTPTNSKKYTVKVIDDSSNRGEVKESMAKDDKKKMKKQDEEVKEEEKKEEEVVAEAPAEEKPAEEAPVEEKSAEEVKKEEAPAEEEKKEEAPVEEEKKEEEVVAEAPAEEKPAEEEKKEEAPAEEKPADVEQAESVANLMKSAISKIDELLAKADEGEAPAEEKPAEEAPAEEVKEESAPAEGVAPEGEAPESGEGEAPKEESAEEAGASPEGAEVAKIEASLGKFSDSITKLSEKVSGQLEEFNKRLTKIEETEAPSKVVAPTVVSKVMANDKPNLSEEDQKRLDEITKELGELEDLMKKDLNKYQMANKSDDALKLLDEKRDILARSGGRV